MKDDDANQGNSCDLVEDSLEFLSRLERSVTLITKGGNKITFCGPEHSIYKTGWWGDKPFKPMNQLPSPWEKTEAPENNVFPFPGKNRKTRE